MKGGGEEATSKSTLRVSYRGRGGWRRHRLEEGGADVGAVEAPQG
jgi:hypothetical protein